MNKLIALLAIAMAICATVCQAQVNSGEYRFQRVRLSPGSLRRRFTLTKTDSPRFAGRQFGQRKKVGSRRPSPDTPKEPETSAASNLGPASALRGQRGSYDIADQQNAILPDRNLDKPTKEESNPNKINIESKLVPETEDSDIITERVHVGHTAIVHCAFDNMQQVGAYRQAKIWWTKLSETGVSRPVIVAAGTQVRIPDDRLRVVTFPDNTFSILIIKNVLPEDAGQYKCSLPTVTGTRTSFTALEVEEAESDMLAISPRETSLNSGDELNLFCKPEDDSLSVWWTAKDASGNNIDVTRGFDRVAGKTLTIRNIQRNQAGVYTCHVDFGVAAPIRRHFSVVVKERPWPIEAYIAGFKINSLLAKYNKDPVYGDNVNLRCDTGGVPTPTVTWYKSGVPLSDSYKFSISSYEPSYTENAVISKLTIKAFQRSEEGTYECRASNDAGTQSQEFNIRGVESDDPLPADDEDYARAALKGRNGALRISICKAGRPCKTKASGRDDVEEYSGDGRY
ncbi:protein amalgam-like [Watersipora subatra]|uniref:protein amalgam-like n=1 Tax=Watersipora subatra TaxID=2589382 RepID=UPI00355C0036